MNKNFLFILLLLFIPLANAEPPVTSYWGYVTYDSLTTANASVTVLDSSGNSVASTISLQDATYRVFVPWDDLGTQADEGIVSGETITFKVEGTTATSVAINSKGSSTRLDLTASSSTTSSSPGGSTSSGGGGGGGGGGGTSGENFTNIGLKEKYEEAIYKDRTTSFGFKSADNPIIYVNITGNVNAGLIPVTVEVLKGTSAFVKEAASGIVYKNINIWVGTSGFATSKNIKETAIGFRVLNSWISDNDLEAGTLNMVRWNGTAWANLETVVKKKDEIYTYFEAKGIEFGNFAITSRAKENFAPAITAEKTTAIPATPVPVQGKSTPGFEFVLVIAVFSAIYIVLKKRI